MEFIVIGKTNNFYKFYKFKLIPIPYFGSKFLLSSIEKLRKQLLEKMNEGQILEVTLSDGEPIESVPENIEIDGHEILEKIVNGKNSKLLIKKK